MPRVGLTFPVPGQASMLQGGKAATRDAATGEQTGTVPAAGQQPHSELITQ